MGGSDKGPILYLRPFALDSPRRQNKNVLTAIFGGFGGVNIEQKLCEILSERGPVVLVGRPNEAMPHLGASRMYLRDEDWQSVVLDLMAKSQVVVLRGGETRGLMWELEKAVRTVPPGRLLLFLSFPAGIWGRQREIRYGRFKEWANSVLPLPLPERIGNSCIIYFSDSWEPQLLQAVDPEGDVPLRFERHRLVNTEPASLVSPVEEQVISSLESPAGTDANGDHPLHEDLEALARTKAFLPGTSFLDARAQPGLLAVLVGLSLILILIVGYYVLS